MKSLYHVLSEFAPVPDSYAVRGRIRDENNRPVEGFTVQAFDKDPGIYLHPDDRLGKARTDAEGNFEIVFRPETFKDWFENNPDVYLRVRDREGRVVLETQGKENTTRDILFQVKLSKEQPNPLAPDIYGGSFRRAIAAFRSVGEIADLSRSDVRVVSELLLRTLDSWAFYRDRLASLTGYDGIQVPEQPRRSEHIHATRWDRPVLPE